MTERDGEQEYWALRQGAGLVELSVWSAVEVRGADRAAFLHRLLTNALSTLSPSAGCEAGLTTAAAKIIAMLLVLADTDAHWLLLNRARLEAALKTLDRYIITDDVQLVDHAADLSVFALLGPTSAAALHAEPPKIMLSHAQATIGSVPIRVVRYSFGLPEGYVLIAPAAQASMLRQQLLERGAVSVVWDAFNIARLEAGLPWEGVDFNDETLLPETGLERRAVSYTKGCYVGQEIIARMDTYGSASRKLVGVLGEGAQPPKPGDVVALEDQEIGQVTSAAWSPTLKRPIALAWIKRPYYEKLGVPVTIRSADSAMAAKLVQPPFV